MSLPVPLSRRATAAMAAMALAAGGLLVSTRAGAAPEPGYGPAMKAELSAGAVRGLDPSLQEVAGRTPAGRPQSRAAAPARDAAGRVLVEVSGDDASAVASAVRSAGGEVSGAVPGRVQAAVPASALAGLAGARGVRSVQPVRGARTHAFTGEGVVAAGAQTWHAGGHRGAGVKIGIVDVGFEDLQERKDAGELPAGLQLAPGADFCLTERLDEDHGTDVATVVHDMAPDATLVLACADTQVGFSQAADHLADQGVTVANASLGFPLAGRGDGSGLPGSPADTVRRSRQQDGILWVVSAGNEAQQHLAGTVKDADRDGWIEFAGADETQRVGASLNAPGEVTFQWDAWPRTNADLDLFLMSEDRVPTGPDDPAIAYVSAGDQFGTPGGTEPYEGTITDGNFYVVIGNVNAPLGLRWDMYMYDVAAPERTSPGGSIAEPATSPWALAVGAACVATGQLEPYSSQGPTIDGRVKPDITGYDGVGLTGPGGVDCNLGVRGTSFSAPGVAGAAALLRGARPGLDPAEVQGLLEARAIPAGPPGKDNLWGAGALRVGPAGNAAPPAGGVFTPLANPVRVLDTRTAVGGHRRPFAAGEEFPLLLRGISVPPEAEVAVLTVTGTNSTTGTYLSVYPQTFSGTSTLNLAVGETAANLTHATLAADGSTVIRNQSGLVNVIVDVVGYYRLTDGETFVPRATPARILDTRTALGGHQRPLAPGEAFALPVRGVAGVPAAATAAVLSVTGTGGTAARTFLAVFPTAWNGTSTVNLTRGATRAGLAVSGIGADGKVRILNNLGSTHVVVDLAGWYVPTGGGRYVPLQQPTRYLDTRTGTGLRLGRLGVAAAYPAPVAGVGTIPADATAVAGNLTGTAASVGTYLSAYPAGTTWPGNSTVNVPVGRTVPNAVQLKPGTAGGITVRNAAGAAHAVLDVTGYFVP